MEKENLIRPSLLSADFTNLDKDVQECIKLGITHIHFDVMDGSFVEDISFGEPIFKLLNNFYSDQIVFDVHLMTVNPLKQAASFARLGAKEICFHYEALTLGDFPRIKQLKEEFKDLKLGLAFSPETKVEEIASILSIFDYVLVMSVIPGKGGQKFISGSEKKIADLDEFRTNFNLSYKIGVDGGINEETARLCLDNHVDWMVAGSYYFHANDKLACLHSLHKKNIIK